MVTRIILDNGVVKYFLHGDLHREDGPAIISPDGYKAYYQNGQRHREDGPAIIWASGSRQYWLDGEIFTKQQFDKIQMQKETEYEWRTS